MIKEIFNISRALGDQTRFEIYRFISDRTEPVSIAEISKQFDLHPNAIRQHLTKLEEANLVVSELHRGSLGRPHKAFKVNRDQTEFALFERDYKFLSHLLIEFMKDKKISHRALRSFGERWGQAYSRTLIKSPKSADAVFRDLIKELGRWGFEPEVQHSKNDLINIKLRNCIFRELATGDSNYACTLIDGIAKGMIGAHLTVESLKIVRGIPRGDACCEIKIGLADCSKKVSHSQKLKSRRKVGADPT